MTALATRLEPCRSTLLASLRACLSAIGDRRDAADVAGLSGLAFHLNVDAAISPSGVAAYPWGQELPGMVARLGYEIELIYADDEDPQFDRKQEDAARLVAQALSLGAPSILFGVHLPEFGIVHGYDAERRELLVSGVLDERGGASRLPVSRLGRGDVPILLLATLRSGRAELDASDAQLAAVRHAVRHARNLGPRLGGFTCGLDAYATWQSAIDRGAVDPAGHAYAVQVTAELRAAAAPFLSRIAERDSPLAAGADHFQSAARCYQRAADRMTALAADTPFPPPEDFNFTTSVRAEALAALHAIAEAEAEGVEHLEQALDANRRTRATAALRIEDATPADAADLFRYIEDMPLAELPAVATALRERVAPTVGKRFRAKLARTDHGEVVGLLHFADLDDAGAPIRAAGKFLYLYYAWVARDRRRCGIGKAMIDALVADARELGCEGIFAEATDQPVYLPAEGFAALGFHVHARGEDAAALMYLPVTLDEPNATLTEPAPQPDGPLRIIVAQNRPCPLMALARENVAAAARRARERGAPIDLEVRDGSPNEILIGDRRLPLTYIPSEAAEMALVGAAEAWSRRPR